LLFIFYEARIANAKIAKTLDFLHVGRRKNSLPTHLFTDVFSRGDTRYGRPVHADSVCDVLRK
jgi:hypothetical protein